MRRLMMATMVLASAMCAAEPATWWNADFAYRVPVTVNTLFWARTDAVAQAKVDFAALLKAAGQFDPNSIRVVDAANRLAPCQVVDGELRWVIKGKQPALTDLRYYVYFDTLAHGPKPASAQVAGEELALNANPVKNASFEEPDPADAKRAAHWDFGKHTPATVCRSDEDAHSGRYSLRVDTRNVKQPAVSSVSQRVPAEPGKVYIVRAWVKFKAYDSGAAGVWAWYRFAERQKRYGNYKTFASGRGTTDWLQVRGCRINVFDRNRNENTLIGATLPGTAMAKIAPGACYGNIVVYIDDVEFLELNREANRPLEVTLGQVESRPR